MHAYRDRAGMIRILEQATASSDEFLRARLEIRKRFSARIEQALRTQMGRHGSVGPNASDRLDPTIGAYALGGMVEDFARGCDILHQLVEEEEAIDTLAVIWARAVDRAPGGFAAVASGGGRGGRDRCAGRQMGRGRLAGYRCPKACDFVDELPRNATGKVLRRELREPYWAGRERRIN